MNGTCGAVLEDAAVVHAYAVEPASVAGPASDVAPASDAELASDVEPASDDSQTEMIRGGCSCCSSENGSRPPPGWQLAAEA